MALPREMCYAKRMFRENRAIEGQNSKSLTRHLMIDHNHRVEDDADDDE